MRYFAALVVWSVIASSSVSAAAMNCKNPEYADFGPCNAEALKRDEAKLTAAWKRAVASVGGTETSVGTDLLVEQKAWYQFKQKACAYYYNQEYYGRDGIVIGYPTCMMGVIRQRIKFLNDFSDGSM